MSLAELWSSWRSEWIVYEDDDLVVVDKPAGMATLPNGAHSQDDGRSRLAKWLQQRDGGPAPRLSIMHGFDREASGLVVFSRRPAVNRALAEQWAQGVVRRYVVGVESLGSLRDQRCDRGGEMESLAPRVLARTAGRHLVTLRTGARSQPIRRQLAALGAPIAGDRTNAGPPARRLMLHATALELVHPSRQTPLDLEAPVPPCFATWLKGTGADQLDDDDALAGALRDAADRRYALATGGGTNAFRLVHGEADGLSGVTLDVYDQFFVVALTGKAGHRQRRARIIEAAFELGPEGIYLKLPPKKASALTPTHREQVAPARAVRGRDAPDGFAVREADAVFEVRLGDGLSTGLFVDQRDARRRVRERAAGARLLNLFGYTGAFTVAAAAGGARQTITVDSSRRALDWALRNLHANGADPQAHQLVRSDVRRWLQGASRRGERFDRIVLDPPSFSTTKHTRFRADKDYRSLARAAFLCLAPGGELLACTNHRGIVLSKFRQQVRRAAKQAGHTIVAVENWPCPSDFPAPPGGESHLKSILITTK